MTVHKPNQGIGPAVQKFGHYSTKVLLKNALVRANNTSDKILSRQCFYRMP